MQVLIPAAVCNAHNVFASNESDFGLAFDQRTHGLSAQCIKTVYRLQCSNSNTRMVTSNRWPGGVTLGKMDTKEVRQETPWRNPEPG